MEETALPGGRMTDGVVRVGNTVRRPATSNSGFVARVLKFLASQGFEGAPRYLGQDERGRDTFSFIDGEVPAKLRHLEDHQVYAGARLLRRLHDVTEDVFGEGLVVCHHDAGPYNAVFVDKVPIAFIDWDYPAPGHPIDDLGYFAWLWCLSSRPDRGPVSVQGEQLLVAAQGYGLGTGLLNAIARGQSRNIEFWTARREHHERADTMISWTIAEQRHLEANWQTFDDILTPGSPPR